MNEVIKAGSLGHGTAVPGDFDLDLVIYSSGIHGSCIFLPWCACASKAVYSSVFVCVCVCA